MHRFVGAKTGWGKSWYSQQIMAANAPEYPIFVVLDYKDEYRGLVKSSLANWLALGPAEAEYGPVEWRQIIGDNPRLVIARHRLDAADWREAVAPVVQAARDLGQQVGGAFVAVEEAHRVAPQSAGTPDPINGLATTGRGEQASSLWTTQRPALIEETILAQADERLLGAFTSDRDLSKIADVVDYPVAVHNPLADLATLPDAIRAPEAGAAPVRKFETGGSTEGSEWIYSNDAGDLDRRDTREVEPLTDHHGPEGREIYDP